MFIYLNKNANEALCRFYFHKKIKLFLTQINVSFLANGTSGKFCINWLIIQITSALTFV